MSWASFIYLAWPVGYSFFEGDLHYSFPHRAIFLIGLMILFFAAFQRYPFQRPFINIDPFAFVILFIKLSPRSLIMAFVRISPRLSRPCREVSFLVNVALIMLMLLSFRRPCIQFVMQKVARGLFRLKLTLKKLTIIWSGV